jgi:recombination protein RecR
VKIPKSISNLIDTFERLPGIGPKTAQRLTFYLLNFPQLDLDNMGKSFSELKKNIQKCDVCKNISDQTTCSICSDYTRDKQLIAVVSGPLDVYALEKTGFKGTYHVLHGLLNPLENIGPDELYIDALIERLTLNKDSSAIEVILSTNTSMEGESTALYISKLIKNTLPNIKVTRIARGLPVGGDIEYADDNTLTRAIEGRGEF